MNSEKVKEIKECLQSCNDDKMACYDCKYYGKCEKILTKNNILTLINELESENAYKQEHVELWFRKNEEKKKRIAELENRLQYTYKQAREEAINDVVQKLKTKFATRKSFLMLNKDYVGLINIIFDSIYTDLTNIAKEFGVDLRG